MKQISAKRILLFAAFFMAGTAAALFPQELPVRIFPFKSAIITYRYEASFSGTHIKYIDDYGFKQADYITKKENFGGNTEEEQKTVILIGDKAYSINRKEGTVALGRNITYGYYRNNQDRSCIEVSDAIMKAAGNWHRQETVHFLNRECTAWKSGINKKVTWKGLELKSTINFITMMVEKAVKIEMNTVIPETAFTIPEGLHYDPADIYEGFSGLKLNFDRSYSKDETENRDERNKKIILSFNSESLERGDNFIYYTSSGKKVFIKGSNDYNKIDTAIIWSQKYAMNKKPLIMNPTQTLIFITDSGFPGKMQINTIDETGYTVRYAVFNNNGTINNFSRSAKNTLKKDFSITPDNNNHSLIMTPEGKTVCFILD